MPYPDLLPIATVQSALSDVLQGVSSQAALPLVISAASQRVQRFCKRVFPQGDYAEILMPMAGQYDKNEPDIIHVSFPPIQQSTLNPAITVRAGRSPALLINNTAVGTAQAAYFQTMASGDPELGLQTNYGLRTVLVSGGVQTVNTFPFFRQPTSTGFSVAASGSGGTLSTGIYLCAYSNVNPAGESILSATTSVPVTSGQNLVFTLPALIPQAASNNVYVSTVGGGSGTMTLQNSLPIVATSYTVSTLAAGASPQATSYGLLSQLQTGINALGNGWQATVQAPSSLASWSSDDVWAAQSTMIGCLSTGQTQGLDVFMDWIAQANTDIEGGAIFMPQNLTTIGQGPGNLTQWPGTADFANDGGLWREALLVKYAGGYPSVPQDVQEATLRVIRDSILNLQTNTQFAEETVDKWKYRLTSSKDRALSKDVRQLLAPYVLNRV